MVVGIAAVAADMAPAMAVPQRATVHAGSTSLAGLALWQAHRVPGAGGDGGARRRAAQPDGLSPAPRTELARRRQRRVDVTILTDVDRARTVTTPPARRRLA
ncbi:MAG: hypothetical protein ACLFTL_12355, partial [Alphaproteobacteria bacterium]